MDIRNHLRFVEEIERKIEEQQLDTLVMGMGISAWLVPWLKRSVMNKLRVWGAHDVWRIWPVDDLILMDSPYNSKRLHMHGEPFRIILESRPKRLWLYDGNAQTWEPHLHACMEGVTQRQEFFVWHKPRLKDGETHPTEFLLEWNRPHTVAISPIGCATLAWQEGSRRIGVIGVECGPDHNTHQMRDHIDKTWIRMADQAHAAGGVICNLSPVTHCRRFKEWKPSASASEPTAGNATAEPKPS